jgi:hypothetical protein
MFEHPNDKSELERLDKGRLKWWKATELAAWLSLLSFICGVIFLTGFFIYDTTPNNIL